VTCSILAEVRVVGDFERGSICAMSTNGGRIMETISAFDVTTIQRNNNASSKQSANSNLQTPTLNRSMAADHHPLLLP